MVRDKYGRKMSKSLGNVIDPLEVIQIYICILYKYIYNILMISRNVVVLLSIVY